MPQHNFNAIRLNVTIADGNVFHPIRPFTSIWMIPISRSSSFGSSSPPLNPLPHPPQPPLPPPPDHPPPPLTPPPPSSPLLHHLLLLLLISILCFALLRSHLHIVVSWLNCCFCFILLYELSKTKYKQREYNLKNVAKNTMENKEK